MFFDHLQVGGRLRLLTTTERICDVTSSNSISCGSDWNAGRRIGVHLAYEQQVQYSSPTLVMPSLWLGLDW